MPWICPRYICPHIRQRCPAPLTPPKPRETLVLGQLSWTHLCVLLRTAKSQLPSTAPQNNKTECRVAHGLDEGLHCLKGAVGGEGEARGARSNKKKKVFEVGETGPRSARDPFDFFPDQRRLGTPALAVIQPIGDATQRKQQLTRNNQLLRTEEPRSQDSKTAAHSM